MENEISPDLSTLTQLSAALSEPESDSVRSVRIMDPLDAAEKSFSNFATHSFACVEKDLDFEEELKDVIRSRYAEASFKDITSFYNATHVNNTARMERLINPFASIAAATRAAEKEKGPSVATASTIVYDGANQDVLQGIVQLNMILQKMAAENNKKKAISDSTNGSSTSSS